MNPSEIMVAMIEDNIAGKMLVCDVGHGCIARRDPAELVHVFGLFGGACEELVQYAGKMLVGLSGYDKDSRELFEVDAVRDFLQDFAKLVPWWLLLVHPSISFTWMCCLIPKPLVIRSTADKIGVRPNWAALHETMSAAVDNCVAHARNLGIDQEDLMTLRMNLEITTTQIAAGMDQEEIDPYFAKLLREARAKYN